MNVDQVVAMGRIRLFVRQISDPQSHPVKAAPEGALVLKK